MTIEDDFDPSVYTRSPKLEAAAAVALSIQLLRTVPKKPTQAVKAAARNLRKQTILLQSSWRERDRFEKPADPRPIDIMADVAMSRLYSRMEAYGGLPEDRYPLATRARALLSSLFPTRLAFLKGDFQAQWAETQKRIERIEEEKLEDDINRIAGPEFLAEVRRIHVLYGDAVGATSSRRYATADLPSLVDPLRAVSAAIVAYSIQLVAIVTDDSTDEASRGAARMALSPLDDHRVALSRRNPRRPTEGAPDDTTSEEATPDSEVPEVPK